MTGGKESPDASDEDEEGGGDRGSDLMNTPADNGGRITQMLQNLS